MLETDAPNALARPKLRDQLVDRLCELIVNKKILPGQPLPTVKALGLEYGVSHTVVRETMGVLESRGLIDVRHGVGTFVNPPEAWDIAGPIGFLVRSDRAALLDWLEVRTAIEVEATALAAERATAEDVGLLRRLAAGVVTEDCEESTAADISFHTHLALTSGNPMLAKIVRAILQPMARSLVEAASLPFSATSAASEHTEVIDAISTHDAEGARQAMRRHLARVREEIEQLLQQ